MRTNAAECMASLPFVQAPKEPEIRRCGNAQTGILEFPVLGGLTVGEAQIIEDMSGGHDSLEKTAQLAQSIQQKEKITLMEAIDIVDKAVQHLVLSPKSAKIAERYTDAIAALRRHFYEEGSKKNNAAVIALIRCRLNLPDWDDLAHLHKDLWADILKLAGDELTAEETPKSEPLTEDQIKKQPAENKNGKVPITSGFAGS